MYGSHEDYAPLATHGDAHREWHTNSGVPMGMPGCPQDACHPPEPEYVPATQVGVKCGNKSGNHWEGWMHHATAAEVRECYEQSGLIQTSPASEVLKNSFGSPMHQTPCVCSAYNRCHGVRAEDARRSGNPMDRFRSCCD